MQDWQAVAPVFDWNKPTLQPAQAEAPAAEYEPTSQLVQRLEARLAYVPAAQIEHTAELVALFCWEYRPAAQAWHTTAPGMGWYEPEPQFTQPSEPEPS